MEAEEAYGVTGVADLDRDDLLPGSGAVVGAIGRPEEDPEDPIWRLGVQF